MKLHEPTNEFISEILNSYSNDGGNELNDKLLKLFQEFNNDKNKFDVQIKVAALNTIYATAIININPVSEQIIKLTIQNVGCNNLHDYIKLIDNMAKVKWTNRKGESFQRNNLSFASKYVHFLSKYETPIYDSYAWLIIKGYLGQCTNEKMSFTPPKDFADFYATFEKFKKELKLDRHTNYELDKFLWHYGKMKIREIEKELSCTLSKAKSELQKRLKKSTANKGFSVMVAD